MVEYIRPVIAMLAMLIGTAFSILGVIGTFKMDYVLNRMHPAAMIDTCAIGFNCVGLIVLCGFNFTSLKLFLAVMFLWFSSPVASHLISSLNHKTHRDDIMKICEYKNLDGGSYGEDD